MNRQSIIAFSLLLTSALDAQAISLTAEKPHVYRCEVPKLKLPAPGESMTPSLDGKDIPELNPYTQDVMDLSQKKCLQGPAIAGFLFPVNIRVEQKDPAKKLFQKVTIKDTNWKTCQSGEKPTPSSKVQFEYFRVPASKALQYVNTARDIHMNMNCCYRQGEQSNALGHRLKSVVTAEVAYFAPPAGLSLPPIPFGQNAVATNPKESPLYQKPFPVFPDEPKFSTTLEKVIESNALLQWGFTYEHDFCNTAAPKTSCGKKYCLKGWYQTRENTLKEFSASESFQYDAP